MKSESELENYQRRAKLILAPQEGHYRSISGATLTPLPLWAVDFRVGRRRIGQGYQVVPITQDGLSLLGTPTWASEVTGPGAEKEKWRGRSFERPGDPSNIFAVASSAWLVPFAIAHRYLVHLPAEMSGSGVVVRKDTVAGAARIARWVTGEDSRERHLRAWGERAQRVWLETKRGKAFPYVTDRLDRQKGLSAQPAHAVRVVHTRSRSFYAAVLDPTDTTALGLPMSAAVIRTREDGRIIQTEERRLAGIICDNLLHWISTRNKDEAYFLVGLFNSGPFNALVMSETQGEPPGIYSLPVKVMDGYNLVYDERENTHKLVSKLARELEGKMRTTVLRYFKESKNINPELIDDTTESQDVPSAVSSAMLRRLGAADLMERLDTAVKQILAESA